MTLTQSRLDELLDPFDGAGSEVRLRAAVQEESHPTARAELITQVVRTLGMQGRIAEGDALLDEVADDAPIVQVRVLLERARLRNAGGDPLTAKTLFEDAAALAATHGMAFQHVDALHVIARIDTGNAGPWVQEALRALDGAESPRLLRWHVVLNLILAKEHLAAERYAEAVTHYERADAAAARWGTQEQKPRVAGDLARARAAQSLAEPAPQ